MTAGVNVSGKVTVLVDVGVPVSVIVGVNVSGNVTVLVDVGVPVSVIVGA